MIVPLIDRVLWSVENASPLYAWLALCEQRQEAGLLRALGHACEAHGDVECTHYR